MPVEEITLTAKFKMDLVDVDEAVISEIYRLFEEYREIVNELIEYAHSHGITSPRRLWYAKYHELRQKYPTIPPHYIHTACRLTSSIYRCFLHKKRLRMCEGERPIFKGRTIWLDDKLFKLDSENWKASIILHGRKWITLRLFYGRYHDKFKGMMPGEARLVLKEDGDLYLNVSFSQMVMLPEISIDAKVIAFDINENVIAYGNNDFIERIVTNEGIIRTRYFLKRRRIQTKIRDKQLQYRLLEKYKGREWQRTREIYYKTAREIIGKALEIGASVIVMENLKHLREDDKCSKELNGRLHRWSYRRFQQILEYEAKLHGLNVKYTDPAYTSRTCPACGGKLSPNLNGCRLMRCRKCGLEEDRDVIAVKNLTKRYYEECASAKISQTFLMSNDQTDVGSSRSPRKPSNEMRREGPVLTFITGSERHNYKGVKPPIHYLPPRPDNISS